MIGKTDLLRLGRLVVGFLVQAFGQRVQGERHVVGDEGPVGGGEQMGPGLSVLGRRRQRGLFQIPAVHLDLHGLARAAPNGKILVTNGSSPMVIRYTKLSRPRNRASLIVSTYSPSSGTSRIDDRVRVGTEIIVVRDLLAVGVVKLQHGLKPAGNAVGDVGDQIPSLGGDEQALPLARRKTIPVHLARRDLAVHRAGDRDAHLLLFQRPFALGQVLFAEHRELHGLHRLAGDFGHLAHVEGQRVGDPPFGDDPEFPPARLCVGGHRDLGKDEFGLGTNGRVALVFREDPFDPVDQLLLGHFLLGLGRFALRVLCARFGVFGFLQIRIALAADGGVQRVGRTTDGHIREGTALGPVSGPMGAGNSSEAIVETIALLTVVSFFFNSFSCWRSKPISWLSMTR